MELTQKEKELLAGFHGEQIGKLLKSHDKHWYERGGYIPRFPDDGVGAELKPDSPIMQ